MIFGSQQEDRSSEIFKMIQVRMLSLKLNWIVSTRNRLRILWKLRVERCYRCWCQNPTMTRTLQDRLLLYGRISSQTLAPSYKWYFIFIPRRFFCSSSLATKSMLFRYIFTEMCCLTNQIGRSACVAAHTAVPVLSRSSGWSVCACLMCIWVSGNTA